MKTFIRALIVVSMGLLPSLVYAEDIDIYMEPRGEAGSEPLVMFNLDYRSNLGSTFNISADDRAFFVAELGEENVPAGTSWTYFIALRTALKVVFKDLAGVKVGLMLPHNQANNCAGPQGEKNKCANGGYIAMGFQSVFKDDENDAKAKFLGILEAMPNPQGGLSHSWQGKEIWFEFYRYLTGGGVYNGRNGYASYPGGHEDYSQNKNLDDPTQGLTGVAWDQSIMAADGSNWRYISPLADATHCTKVFTISFTFGNSNQDSDSDSAIAASPASGGMGISMQGNSGSFENVLKFMNDADIGSATYLGDGGDINGKQNVVGWFITDQTNPSRHALAAASGTSLALGVLGDPQLLVETLNSIFQQILSVSTTFVSASVPVNVFNRSEIVDNVYIALFQADPQGRPAWPGSLKKLKIDQTDGVVRLIDQNFSDAVAADGRINFSALTYWTEGGALPPPDLESGEIDGRDGRSVDRGGAGQKIPGFISGGPGTTNADGARQLFTEPGAISNGATNVLMDLDAEADVAAALLADIGSADATAALEMLKWMRGMDVDNLSIRDPADPTLARPWILGDPLHSRPLPINYGAIGEHTLQNPDIRIMMGSNDGYLRMFRNTNAAGADVGEEVWGFMPRMVMDKMETLRTNVPAESGPPHPYTVDGAPVVYTRDINGNGTIDAGDRVIVYFGLRRGGEAYYALDVTDPDDPYLLWRITSADAGFETLGKTFSTPQVGTLSLNVDGTATPTPIIVFGGGYDTNKDARGAGGTNDDEGNSIYVVNALTGELIWNAVHDEMVDSIPSDVTIVDTSGDGYTDRIYVGDTGGTVWRVDLVGDPDDDWLVYPLARLGRHFDDDSPANERRFFHAPDVVLARDSESAYDAVIIGSGDRANPLDKGYAGVIPENYLYMIKDRRTVSRPLQVDEVLPEYDPTNLGDVTSNCIQAGDCDDEPGGWPDLTHGWRLQLAEASGEKSLALPFTIGGTIFFTTYLPPGEAEASTCGPSEGGGLLYAVALADARSTINFDSTDDDPDNPGEATSSSDRTDALLSGGIPAEVVSLPPNRVLRPDLSTVAIPGSMRWRTYWYEREQTP